MAASPVPASPKRSTRTKLLAVAIGALVALGAACKPVQPLGEDLSSPVGVLDSVTGGVGEVTVTGWAAEWPRFVDDVWRAPAPTRIVLLVDGAWVPQSFLADDPRPDVDRAFLDQLLLQYRRDGSPYGFDLTVAAPAGNTSVCVAALNQWSSLPFPLGVLGDNVLLGCRTVTVT